MPEPAFRVEPIHHQYLAVLAQMLEESSDFPAPLLGQYRTGRGPYGHLVAWRGDRIDGVITGSFDSDLSQSGAFAAFTLPPAPHAFLARVHVRDRVRGRGVGSALVEVYAEIAAEHGCTFIRGSIDLSSDSRARRAFFESFGFRIRQHDNFGARTSEVLKAIAARNERD